MSCAPRDRFFRLVECFDAATNECNAERGLSFEALVQHALQAYFKELDGATLADIAAPAQGRAPPRSGGAPARRRGPGGGPGAPAGRQRR